MDGPPALSPRPGAGPAAAPVGVHVACQQCLCAGHGGAAELAAAFQTGLRFKISQLWQRLHGGDHGFPNLHRTAQHPLCHP